MVLGLSLAIIIGLGSAAAGDDEPPAIPDSPAVALSLEQIAPDPPVIEPWPQEMPSAGTGFSALPAPAAVGGPSPEHIFAALMFTLALALALGARRERVEAATSSVRSRLSDNLFFDVTHGDLASIEKTLLGLSPGERDLVLNALSDREVAVWMRELDGFNGSFSTAEEARLFAGLVPGVNGASLARLVVEGKGQEVVEALADHGSSRQRVALAGELAVRLEGPSKVRRLIPGLIAASDSAVLEAEISRWLADGVLGIHLDRFFGVGVDELAEREAGYRLDAAAALARSGAGFTDPAVKAALFVELVTRTTETRGKRWRGSKEEVLAGTTELLRSDVAGIIGHLNHGVDPHGNTVASWVEEMIDEDRIDELDVVLAELIGGTDRLSHFSDPGMNPADPFPNASNLGYFVGSYHLAIEQIADGAEDKIELVGLLFAIVTGLIPGPKGGSLSLPLGPLVDLYSRDVIDGFQGKATDVKQTLWGLAKPRTAEGLLWNGAGTTQFQDAWEEVVEVR